MVASAMISLRTVSSRSLPVLLPLALALTSCGGSHTPAGDGGLDAPGSLDTGPGDVDAGPGDVDGGVSPCGYVDTIDRSCTTDADCLVRLHQTDCCGSSVMIGIATSALATYNAGEPACMASYPGCGCPAMLPVTDSAETVTDTSAVLAACVSRGPRNVCLTYVTMRPLPGR